ncbi:MULTISPECIES: hypothetical protein [Actinoplanes]|uniref:hypothetical protein n=1 Tax=Actinoplanes TaxID=1865 RepID=UPI001E498538|nr:MULTISPECIES: hypothetical protein [Actinoplanes]
MLTALVLLPAAGLFLRVLQENSKQRDNTQLELDGVEYLSAMSSLITALAESQSSSLQGVATEPASVTAAVSRVQGVDERYGDDLGTKTRWADLKDKIAKLPKVTGTSEAIIQKHIEAADLTLALYDTVRENSTLNRDPESDIWFLQQAAAFDMPTAVTAVSRMADRASMTAGAKTKAQQQTLITLLGYQSQKVQESTDTLTDNLQAAAADTSSDTLSGNLVSNLDSFRRGIEAANRGAPIGAKPNASTLVTAQSTLQTALSALSGVVLKEISSLLEDRMDSLTYKRIEAFGLFGVAIALIVVGAFWTRTRGREAQNSLNIGEPTRDVSVQSAGNNGNQGGNPYGGGNPYDSAPPYGETPNYGGGRERSGALR